MILHIHCFASFGARIGTGAFSVIEGTQRRKIHCTKVWQGLIFFESETINTEIFACEDHK